MSAPLLDLRRQNAPLRGELLQAFERVLDSGQYILGMEVEHFEQAAATLAGARHGIGVTSGTDAILLALMALGIGPGDEVICPSFTFFATAGCIARTGAAPVFADSCPVCFNLDPSGFEQLISPRTRAVIPVHLFGQAAHMTEIMEIARAHELAVIEDAAQALGATYQGKAAGSIGTFGTFSFYPSKNLGGFGDAGLITTNDDALAEKARLLRSHGAKHKYFHKMVGGNFRMDPIQAAMLSVKLPHLVEYSRARSENACEYNTRLAQAPGAAVNTGISRPELEERAAFLLLPAAHDGSAHIWNQYTVRVVPGRGWSRAETPRDALRSSLQQRGIGSEIYYPRPMHQQECFACSGPHAALPVCERSARESVSLPVFGELAAVEKDAVISALSDFLIQNA